MPRVIISDTSCLIVLSKIGQLDLLHKVYGTITTTTTIAQEFGDKLPDWIQVTTVKDHFKKTLLELQIDRGESSAIALALETPESTIILDDQKARKIAKLLGLTFTGTIGVIVKAKLNGAIPSIKPILESIKQTDFRISEELEAQALKSAGE
jgi:predicted nucleic acid-binding protein